MAVQEFCLLELLVTMLKSSDMTFDDLCTLIKVRQAFLLASDMGMGFAGTEQRRTGCGTGPSSQALSGNGRSR